MRLPLFLLLQVRILHGSRYHKEEGELRKLLTNKEFLCQESQQFTMFYSTAKYVTHGSWYLPSLSSRFGQPHALVIRYTSTLCSFAQVLCSQVPNTPIDLEQPLVSTTTVITAPPGLPGALQIALPPGDTGVLPPQPLALIRNHKLGLDHNQRFDNTVTSS